jgi:phosphohistidine phosphatase SixA
MMARRVMLAVLAVLIGTVGISTQSKAPAVHPQLVLLVRHAEKADAPKDDVALTDAGLRRAAALEATVAGASVDTIITSQYRRTRDTAAGVAKATHLTPIVVTVGNDKSTYVRAVADEVRAAGRVVLVVSHSDTLPGIVRALGGPKVDEICDSEYSRLYVLWLAPGEATRTIESSYGAPDPPQAADCRNKM